jgi:hypothetical protein
MDGKVRIASEEGLEGEDAEINIRAIALGGAARFDKCRCISDAEKYRINESFLGLLDAAACSLSKFKSPVLEEEGGRSQDIATMIPNLAVI